MLIRLTLCYILVYSQICEVFSFKPFLKTWQTPQLNFVLKYMCGNLDLINGDHFSLHGGNYDLTNSDQF